MLGIGHEAMKRQIQAYETHLYNVRISLGNFTYVDFELGWQVKILKLKTQELLDAQKS